MATVNLGNIKFNWKGTYNAGTTYAIDDVVSYNGSSYICIQASTGNLPTVTTYWNVMSTAGTNGTDVGTTITTQGDILYRDASGLARLGYGTAGQVLQTGGSGANPSWGTVSSDFVKIATGNFSNVSSLMIDGTANWGTAGTYKSHMLTFTPLKVIGGAYTHLRMRSVKNGTADTGNQYSWAIVMVRSIGTIYDSSGEGVSYMQLSHDYFRGNDNANHSFDIHLHNIHGASDFDYLQATAMTAHSNQDGDQRLHGHNFHGQTHTNHAVNNGRTGIEFHSSHQNISGTWCTYGIK